jgi:hypothetical protein
METTQKRNIHIQLPITWCKWLISKYGSVGLGIKAIIAEAYHKDNNG